MASGTADGGRSRRRAGTGSKRHRSRLVVDLIVLPSVDQERLPAGFAARCKADGAVLVRKFKSRAELVTAALAALDPGSPHSRRRLGRRLPGTGLLSLADRVAGATHALHQQPWTKCTSINKPLRQPKRQWLAMRHKRATCWRTVLRPSMSHASSYLPGGCVLARLDARGRNHDRRVAAPEIAGNSAANLLISGSVAEQLAREQPATAAALQAALAAGTAGFDRRRDERTGDGSVADRVCARRIKTGLSIIRSHCGIGRRLLAAGVSASARTCRS